MKNSHDAAKEKLLDYYRMEPGSLPCTVAAVDESCGECGFFHLGGHVCYGHCQSGTAANVAMAGCFDASKEILKDPSIVRLPFSFAEIIDNLRLERYRETTSSGKKILSQNEVVRRIYYLVRASLPASLRRQLQRAYFRDWQTLRFPAWPID